MAIDAVSRALYRMAISHRHMLQWTTAATAQAQATTRLPSLIRTHWGAPLAALALLGALLALRTPHLALSLGLCNDHRPACLPGERRARHLALV